MPQPFFSGKDAVLRLFLDGDEVILYCKSWKVQLQGTKASDGVNGEDRARMQFLPDFYDISAECYCAELKHQDRVLAYVANTDAQAQPWDAAALISAQTIGGPKKNYGAKEVCVDDFTLTNGGRTDRAMFSLAARARYFDPLPSTG